MGFKVDRTDFSFVNRCDDPEAIRVLKKVPRRGGGNLIYVAGKIERFHLKQNPKTLFLFGENWVDYSGTINAQKTGSQYQRQGNGGMAAEMASEDNGMPIITVLKPPTGHQDDYFREGSKEANAVVSVNRNLLNSLPKGQSVVIPVDQAGQISLGRGIAKLNETAPSVYNSLVHDIAALEVPSVQPLQPDYSNTNQSIREMHLAL